MKNIILISFIFLLSCNSYETKTEQAKSDTINMHSVTPDAADMKTPVLPEISASVLNYSKDPVCGMPMKHDIADTTLYKNKVYGFCAKECKEEFIKNPESFLTQK